MTTPRPRSKLLPLPLLLALLLHTPLDAIAAEGASQEELERRFEETMSGARLVGKFSIVGMGDDQGPREDLYSVSELEKGADGEWIFTYRMGTGADAPALEIPVRVVWADDTPMLTMTDQKVEGLGTFSVRLLIDGNLYSGTWKHGPAGGHMWGTIEKEADN